MWPLLIELIVSFLRKNNTGKIFVTQGKLGENTGNFILARMWSPWLFTKLRDSWPIHGFDWYNSCGMEKIP